MGHCFEPETNNKRWIMLFLFLAIIGLMFFFLCKNKKKKKKKNSFDTDSYDYLTTGDECIACCGDNNPDIGTSANGA